MSNASPRTGPAKSVVLSTDERDLLREWVHLVEVVLGDPPGGVDHLRASMAGGGGFGRNYQIRRGRINATWAHYDVVERFGPDARPDLVGQPKKLAFHPPHRRVSMPLTRLQKWAEGLPPELHWRMAQDRNQRARRAVALEALQLDADRELHSLRAHWFARSLSPSTTTSPHCAGGDHRGCRRGRQIPATPVWLPRPGTSTRVVNTSVAIVFPVEHYTCDCTCHSMGYAGEQLSLFTTPA